MTKSSVSGSLDTVQQSAWVFKPAPSQGAEAWPPFLGSPQHQHYAQNSAREGSWVPPWLPLLCTSSDHIMNCGNWVKEDNYSN